MTIAIIAVWALCGLSHMAYCIKWRGAFDFDSPGTVFFATVLAAFAGPIAPITYWATALYDHLKPHTMSLKNNWALLPTAEKAGLLFVTAITLFTIASCTYGYFAADAFARWAGEWQVAMLFTAFSSCIGAYWYYREARDARKRVLEQGAEE